MNNFSEDVINTIKEFVPKDNQFESISGAHMKALINFYYDYGCNYYEPFHTCALKVNKYGFKIYLLKKKPLFELLRIATKIWVIS